LSAVERKDFTGHDDDLSSSCLDFDLELSRSCSGHLEVNSTEQGRKIRGQTTDGRLALERTSVSKRSKEQKKIERKGNERKKIVNEVRDAWLLFGHSFLLFFSSSYRQEAYTIYYSNMCSLNRDKRRQTLLETKVKRES
jgi:hypothetical protein